MSHVDIASLKDRFQKENNDQKILFETITKILGSLVDKIDSHQRRIGNLEFRQADEASQNKHEDKTIAQNVPPSLINRQVCCNGLSENNLIGCRLKDIGFGNTFRFPLSSERYAVMQPDKLDPLTHGLCRIVSLVTGKITAMPESTEVIGSYRN